MEKNVSISPGVAEGERSSTEAAPEVKRWSANRKKEVCPPPHARRTSRCSLL